MLNCYRIVGLLSACGEFERTLYRTYAGSHLTLFFHPRHTETNVSYSFSNLGILNNLKYEVFQNTSEVRLSIRNLGEDDEREYFVVCKSLYTNSCSNGTRVEIIDVTPSFSGVTTKPALGCYQCLLAWKEENIIIQCRANLEKENLPENDQVTKN